MDTNLKNTLKKVFDKFREKDVEIIKYTDTNKTLSQVNTDLTEINENGYHAFFDVSSMQLTLYLIKIDSD